MVLRCAGRPGEGLTSTECPPGARQCVRRYTYLTLLSCDNTAVELLLLTFKIGGEPEIQDIKSLTQLYIADRGRTRIAFSF